MNTKHTLPTIALALALTSLLGACDKKDSGVGGQGDAAEVTSRTPGSGNSSADGISGGTGNTGNAGLSSTEYNTNITPRTVGNEEGTKQNSLGAAGGASGVDGKVVVDDKGGTTGGGANPGGSPMQGAPAPANGNAGTNATTGHSGDTTGTGPASTKPGSGGAGSIH